MVKGTKEPSNELFFVGVRDPTLVRREILETLRDILEVLHKFEKFKSIRKQKHEHIQKLGSLMKQANRLMGVLRNKLPETNLRAIETSDAHRAKKGHHHKKKKKGEKVHEEQPKKEMTEVDRLEAELNIVEGKLKNLT